jgi:hypothetical protein
LKALALENRSQMALTEKLVNGPTKMPIFSGIEGFGFRKSIADGID